MGPRVGLRLDRTAIAEAIEALLETPPLQLDCGDAVRRALELYRKGPADFSDYLIVALAGDATVLTFDRRLHKHHSCEQP